VRYGAPVSISITPASGQIQQGRTALFSSTVLGANDHLQSGVEVTWSSTCGAVSAAQGVSTVVTASGAPGTACAVTAAYGGLTASAPVTVLPATPFTITITSSSASVGPGGSAMLTAAVKDAYGHPVTGANITWSTTCGSVSPASGPTTTYTPPGSVEPEACAISANVAAGTATGEMTTTVASAGSGTILALGAVAAAAAVGAGLFLMLRKRRQGGSPPPPEGPNL
jgi:hypothetical protein